MDWDRVWESFHRFKASRAWVLALMAPNLAGIGFGYFYYLEVGQFDPASPYFRPYGWWPLIPDSPNAVVLMSASLLLYAFAGRRSRLLDAAAFVAMVYVGLWTTFLFLAYPGRLGTFDWAGVAHGNANPVLFVSHMGMPLQALLLVRDLRRDAWPLSLAAAVLAWGAGSLAVDYWGPHLHPAPFLHDALHLPPAASAADALLHAGSPWIMAATLAAWLAVARRGLEVRSLRRGGGPSPPPSP